MHHAGQAFQQEVEQIAPASYQQQVSDRLPLVRDGQEDRRRIDQSRHPLPRAKRSWASDAIRPGFRCGRRTPRRPRHPPWRRSWPAFPSRPGGVEDRGGLHGIDDGAGDQFLVMIGVGPQGHHAHHQKRSPAPSIYTVQAAGAGLDRRLLDVFAEDLRSAIVFDALLAVFLAHRIGAAGQRDRPAGAPLARGLERSARLLLVGRGRSVRLLLRTGCCGGMRAGQRTGRQPGVAGAPRGASSGRCARWRKMRCATSRRSRASPAARIRNLLGEDAFNAPCTNDWKPGSGRTRSTSLAHQRTRWPDRPAIARSRRTGPRHPRPPC